MRTQTTKSSFVSLVDHLLYITLRINTCHCMYRLWALPVYCTVSGNSLTTCSTEIKCVTPQHATTVSQALNQKSSIRYVSRSNIQYMCCDTLWDCSEGDLFCHTPVLCVYAGKMFLLLSWRYVGVEEAEDYYNTARPISTNTFSQLFQYGTRFYSFTGLRGQVRFSKYS